MCKRFVSQEFTLETVHGNFLNANWNDGENLESLYLPLFFERDRLIKFRNPACWKKKLLNTLSGRLVHNYMFKLCLFFSQCHMSLTIRLQFQRCKLFTLVIGSFFLTNFIFNWKHLVYRLTWEFCYPNGSFEDRANDPWESHLFSGPYVLLCVFECRKWRWLATATEFHCQMWTVSVM